MEDENNILVGDSSNLDIPAEPITLLEPEKVDLTCILTESQGLIGVERFGLISEDNENPEAEKKK